MRLTTTKRLTEQIQFKTTNDAIRAIQSTSTLTANVREIDTSTDYQTLTKHLMSLKRPFGIVIITGKE